MDIDSLVEAIFKRPAIWDKRHKQHSNRIVVENYWKEVAAELQNEEIAVRKKWKYLRDKFAVEYGKQMKSCSGDAADSYPPSKWVFYQQLMFLRDIITPRVSSGSLKSVAQSFSNCTGTETDQPEPEQGEMSYESSLQDEPNQNEVPDDWQNDECMEDNRHQEDIMSTASVESAFSPPSALKRKRRTMDYQNKSPELEERIIQYLLNKMRRGTDEEDSDLMFYKALLCHVRLIPQEKKLQFQGEIQAVVQKYAYASRPSEERMPHYQNHGGSYISSSPSPSTSRKYENETAQQPVDVMNVYSRIKKSVQCHSQQQKKMTLQAIRYHRGNLEILDQLLLPDTSHYFHINNTQEAWNAIKKMQVRGAPAIAIVGCLSLGVELTNMDFNSLEELKNFVVEKLDFLVSARPTAVNMADSAAKGKELVKSIVTDGNLSSSEAKIKVIENFEEMLEKDIDVNKNIGKFGAQHILSHCKDKSINVITHCNTGSLATAGYGTALGVIRCLNEHDKLDHVYCTETRPYNQGARLTAYELVHEKIPASLICDSMAAACMKENDISAVIVGADRVAANGDTANKIGTYQLAIVAKHHDVPFYVACPKTTFDPKIHSGRDIRIEQRPHIEMTSVKGVNIAAPGINCWNPAFDVTPQELITGGFITEFGVFNASQLQAGFTENDKDKVDVIY